MSVTASDTLRQVFAQAVKKAAQLAALDTGGTSPSIEIELRLGKVTHDVATGKARFCAGIDERLFSDFVTAAEHHMSDATKSQATEDCYIVETPPSAGNRAPSHERYLCAPGDTLVASADTKCRVQDWFITGLLENEADARLAVSTEAPVPGTLPEHPPAGCLLRKKSRTSFWHAGCAIDFTRVDSGHPQQEGGGTPPVDTTYEVELELEKTALAFTSESAVESAIDWVEMLRECARRRDPQDFRDVLAGKEITDVSITTRLWAAVNMCFRSTNIHAFPGTIPVALTRGAIATIQAGDYYVCEKSEGMRCMLLILETGAYLFDQRMRFYTAPALLHLCSLLSSAGPTLLDGDLVRHYGEWPWRPCYVVSDVLLFEGERIHESILRERLAVIQTIITRHRDAIASGAAPAFLSMLFTRKNFFQRRDIEQVFVRIVREDRGMMCVDNVRHHMTNGIIFAPNVPHVSFVNATMYEWRWPMDVTVDLCVSVDRQLPHGPEPLVITCAGDDNLEIELRTIHFFDNDERRLRKLVEEASDEGNIVDRSSPPRSPGALPPAASVIVACALDPSTGLWMLRRPRFDKSRPNHINVLIDAMSVVAQNITDNELVYRNRAQLTEDGECADDWDESVAAHGRDLRKRRRVATRCGESAAKIARIDDNNGNTNPYGL